MKGDGPNDAKAFEGLVRSLLTLAGYRVSEERLLGHKRVDSYAEDSTLTSIRRTAVECRRFAVPLTQEEVSQIYANYLPLHRDNLIDEILIVTQNGISATAMQFVASTRELTHLTLAELQRGVIDFASYMTHLVRADEEGGVARYYVRPRTTAGADLESQITDWIDGKRGTPVAILGGYGMGKSTFASHLAATLARTAISDSRARIPILVPLGEISSNQDLPGLLGKLFTHIYNVRNYRLESFLELNDHGRFVVICDGFDEMKHTLSWEEFRFNLREINRLVSPNSRVLILGRPTAFLTDAEQKYALHGAREVRGEFVRDPDWPDYQEIEIAPFDLAQIETFLRDYQEWLIERDLRGSGATSPDAKKEIRLATAAKQIKRVLRNIEQPSGRGGPNQLADLVSRPVHLKMLVDILPEWRAPLGGLTTTILYDLFIDSLVQREQLKAARRGAFVAEDRRRFARAIAWLLWQSSKKSYVRAEDIPDRILLAFAQSKLQGVRRDLVSGSLLERKAGDVLYFPHRSIQEFLVAEEVIAEVPNGLPLAAVDDALTPEVHSFLNSLLNVNDLEKWERALTAYRGKLSWQVGQLWVSEPEKLRWTMKQSESNSLPWYVAFLTAYACRIRNAGDASDSMSVDGRAVTRLANRLVERTGTRTEAAYELLCFACLMGLSRQIGTDHATEAFESLFRVRQARPERISALLPKGSRERRKARAESQNARFSDTDRWLSQLRVNSRTQRIRLESGHRFLRETLQSYCMISDWSISEPGSRTGFVWLEELDVSSYVLDYLEGWQAYYAESLRAMGNATVPRVR